MSKNAHDDKNGRFGERAARLKFLAKLAILAEFSHLCPEMHTMTKMADLAKELHD